MTSKNKWIDAPTVEDLRLLAKHTGYTVSEHPDGFRIRNLSTEATTVVGCADDVIEIVCRRTL
jgi:hypothetical protein